MNYFIGIVMFCMPLCLRGTDCPALAKETPARIVSYLHQRMVSGTDAVPSIISITMIPDSCYRKIEIAISGASSRAVLYLSPDERFLSATLFDLAADPREEVLEIAATVDKELMRDPSPQLIGAHGQVRIVEFGDLECPYCRRLAAWYHELPMTLRDQSVLVFKHLPLPQHPWARGAAIYSACVSLRSSDLFWQLADDLLAQQGEVTLGNMESHVAAVLTRTQNISMRDIADCVANGTGASIVDRDIALAKRLAVHSTPTLFVDGKRTVTVTSAEDLQKVIEGELKVKRTSVEKDSLN